MKCKVEVNETSQGATLITVDCGGISTSFCPWNVGKDFQLIRYLFESTAICSDCKRSLELELKKHQQAKGQGIARCEAATEPPECGSDGSAAKAKRVCCRGSQNKCSTPSKKCKEKK